MILPQPQVTYAGSAPWAVRSHDDSLTGRHPNTPCARCGIDRQVRKGSGSGLCRDCWGWAKTHNEMGIWT
jgi:hypothetical protein